MAVIAGRGLSVCWMRATTIRSIQGRDVMVELLCTPGGYLIAGLHRCPSLSDRRRSRRLYCVSGVLDTGKPQLGSLKKGRWLGRVRGGGGRISSVRQVVVVARGNPVRRLPGLQVHLLSFCPLEPVAAVCQASGPAPVLFYRRSYQTNKPGLLNDPGLCS